MYAYVIIAGVLKVNTLITNDILCNAYVIAAVMVRNRYLQ